MHNFLQKRPVNNQGVSESTTKKKHNTMNDKPNLKPSLKNALTGHCIQVVSKNSCQKSSANSNNTNNNPFLNPFSLETSKKSPSIATKQNRSEADGNLSSQSILKTVPRKPINAQPIGSRSLKKSSVPSTDNRKSSAVATSTSSSSTVGQKRKISSFFSTSNKDCTPTGHTDVTCEDNTQMKENKESSLLNVPPSSSDTLASTGLKLSHSVATSFRAINSINIDTVSEREITGNIEVHNGTEVDRAANGMETVSSTTTENENENENEKRTADHQPDAVYEEEKMVLEQEHEHEQEQVEVEEQEGEGEGEEAAADTADPAPFTPYLIPNLLTPKASGRGVGEDHPHPTPLRTSGVIRSKISSFTQDPQHFSHPARFSLGISRSRLASLVGSKMHPVATPAGAVQLLNTPREARYGAAATPCRRGGVTCVQFDKGGVLCAVGGSNGVLRVYDFDEVTFALHLAANVEIACDPGSETESERGQGQGQGTAVVHPMVHFSGPGRDIADLTWLPSYSGGGEEEQEEEEEEVAVAFTHHPAIHIYDLNTLDRAHCLLPSQERTSGNCCVLCLAPTPPPSLTGTRIGTGKARQKACVNRIVAGGANGILRYWKVPQAGAPSSSSSCRSYSNGRGQASGTKPVWEVLADPLSKAGKTHY